MIFCEGGKGGLSFDLSVRYGIPCTLIEPIEVKLNAITRRMMKKIHERRLREIHVSEYYKKPSMLGYNIEDDFHILDIVSNSVYHNIDSLPFVHIRSEYHFKNPEKSIPKIVETIKNCGMIIGVHPDQATEDIVDAALAYKKPFAILPCCVFAELNPGRIIEGRKVRTYEDLISYLLSKDESIQCFSLPFVGRNKVLYRF